MMDITTLLTAMALLSTIMFIVSVVVVAECVRTIRANNELLAMHHDQYRKLVMWLAENLKAYGDFEQDPSNSNVIHFRPRRR